MSSLRYAKSKPESNSLTGVDRTGAESVDCTRVDLYMEVDYPTCQVGRKGEVTGKKSTKSCDVRTIIRIAKRQVLCPQRVRVMDRLLQHHDKLEDGYVTVTVTVHSDLLYIPSSL